MGLLGKWRASYLYGKALMNFHKKQYNSAVVLLEKVCTLDPDHERSELYHAYLGRSYLGLGRNSDALKVFEYAYELFRRRKRKLRDNYELKEFKDFIDAYIHVLRDVGQGDRAQEIVREIEALDISMQS